jgi:hypothetical protein
VGTHAAIGVDDNFAAGDPAVADRAADNKAAGGVDEIFCILVDHVFRQDWLDDFFHHAFLEVFIIHFRAVLGRQDNGLNPLGLIIFIFNGDLALGIGPQPGQAAVFTDLGLPFHESVGIGNGHGHQDLGFRTGIPEHQPLVAGPLVQVQAGSLVNAHGNIGGLFVNGGQHRARLPVEAHVRGVIADTLDGFPDDLRHIHPGRGGDFAGNKRHTGGDHGLAGDPCLGVLLDNSVQDSIGDLVRDLVRMAFRYGFGCEKIT